jgi:hypothetical protein
MAETNGNVGLKPSSIRIIDEQTMLFARKES